jgi:transposase
VYVMYECSSCEERFVTSGAARTASSFAAGSARADAARRAVRLFSPTNWRRADGAEVRPAPAVRDRVMRHSGRHNQHHPHGGGRPQRRRDPRDLPSVHGLSDAGRVAPGPDLLGLHRAIAQLEADVRHELAGQLGYEAIQAISGIGPLLASVFVAETGDVTRFRSPAQLSNWAGLTPKHHESDLRCAAGRLPNRAPAL